MIRGYIYQSTRLRGAGEEAAQGSASNGSGGYRSLWGQMGGRGVGKKSFGGMESGAFGG